MTTKENEFFLIKRFNKYFKIYLSCLLFFAIFYLYHKHNVGNDTSISEYLINYQGGFVRRGLIGEIIFRYSDYFNLDLRFQIFIFQSSIYTIFVILIFKHFKNFKKNAIILFAIFTPIFLLFPVAELESLGRKDQYLYVFFLSLIFIADPKKANLFILLILPIFCMIYEEIILFSPFIYSVLLIKNKIKNFKTAFKLSFLFIPSILIFFYFFLFPLSIEEHKIMSLSLMNTFNEACYMSCNLVVTNDITNFNSMIAYIWGPHANIPVILIRYFFVILIAFYPIFLLSYHSNFNDNIFFSKISLKNVLLFILLLYVPIIPLFVFGGDWGRWIGMVITFTTIFYFYLYKNNFITVDYLSISKKLIFFKNRKKLVIFIFIIFSFGWNQKTTNVEDIASNPVYKIHYNAVKKIFNLNSFQILQDNIIIKWHKKIME